MGHRYSNLLVIRMLTVPYLILARIFRSPPEEVTACQFTDLLLAMNSHWVYWSKLGNSQIYRKFLENSTDGHQTTSLSPDSVFSIIFSFLFKGIQFSTACND